MCACAWQGHVCWLAPHTDWCPQVGRNFLEIVSNHRSIVIRLVIRLVSCVGRGVCRCGCAMRVRIPRMPSGQSEEYTISSPYTPIKRG